MKQGDIDSVVRSLPDKYKILDPEVREQAGTDLKKVFLMPLTIYALFCLSKHPGGWLIINFIVPMKGLSEYADIHEKILKYVMTRDEE